MDTSIAQIIHNYRINLPIFLPQSQAARAVHQFMLNFYQHFGAAAHACGISETDQPKILEQTQKTLWAFGGWGQIVQTDGGPGLVLDRQAIQTHLKIVQPEKTLDVLSNLGAQIEYQVDGSWQPQAKLKASAALRLQFDPTRQPAGCSLSAALTEFVQEVKRSTVKEKAAYERFLRANPQAVLAGEKPPIDKAPDDPAILANLPDGAAAGWRALVDNLRGYPSFTPMVEFRSIHHGLWTVNYNGRSGSRDLCGLIVQNGLMTVRIILYGQVHFEVKDRLEDFGEPVMTEFFNAHYYEEFAHQWLFVPVNSVADTVGIKKLLALVAERSTKR